MGGDDRKRKGEESNTDAAPGATISTIEPKVTNYTLISSYSTQISELATLFHFLVRLGILINFSWLHPRCECKTRQCYDRRFLPRPYQRNQNRISAARRME